ncbi:MAG: pyoverdine/dityrosine biosynthesis protein Dit1/alpha-ketoglutarate-dependent taurine dioxygenase [Phenylobacterium sp.]|jgi:pyoverdine/dityrosine biosynthesis protein Dit1/alpha-ketoglutarate-dependent taurine dioxygenase
MSFDQPNNQSTNACIFDDGLFMLDTDSTIDDTIHGVANDIIDDSQVIENSLLNNTDHKIVALIQRYLVAGDNDQFLAQGCISLLEQVRHFTARQQQLEFILPGFPCKSPNDIDKTFSALPDYGEAMAIERLDTFCGQLNNLYMPGAEVTILSDGTTFADVVEVSDQVQSQYNQALRTLTVTENIVWADLSAVVPGVVSGVVPGGVPGVVSGDADKSADDLRKALVKPIANGARSFEKFVATVQRDPKQADVHDKLCSYLYHDVNLERFSGGDRDNYLELINEKAYLMMYRGKALSHGIEQAFPDHIRLSVHQYDNSGPKFTFGLSANSSTSIAPWHSVPVRLLNGQFVQLPHSIAKEWPLAKVTYQQQNWCYIEVPIPELAKLTYEVVKGPKFGLKLTDPTGKAYSFLTTEFMQKLSEDFGFVVLKDAPIEEQTDLVNFCQPFGEIYQWKFGPVHVVKPEANPSGFVHSIEKTPLHWDLSMLPLSDEKVKKDARFAASTFMLYCKTAPVAGEGQTTLVDSRQALKIAGQDRVNLWKQIDVTYQTKMTYFGGDAHTYPLVFAHPTTGVDILRYQEGSELEMQKFVLSNEQCDSDDFAALVQDVNDVAYDERCLVKHQWEDGDLVIVDNLYTLHGRLAMTEKSMSRELWRVQVS